MEYSVSWSSNPTFCLQCESSGVTDHVSPVVNVVINADYCLLVGSVKWIHVPMISSDTSIQYLNSRDAITSVLPSTDGSHLDMTGLIPCTQFLNDKVVTVIN